MLPADRESRIDTRDERFIRAGIAEDVGVGRSALGFDRQVRASDDGESQDSGGNGRVPGPSVESLAIPGYDTLSASQVVQRLGGLSADELEAVRAYEESSRKRKTILARVEQLQSGS